MYQRRRKSGIGIFPLIIIGVLVGVGYLVYDNFLNQDGDAPAPQPTQVDVAQQPAQPTPIPQSNTVSDETTPTNNTNSQPDIPQGTTLFIPSAGIYADIVQVYVDDSGSWDVSHLGLNVGHLQGTQWLGHPGNVVLSGHVELGDGRKGVFATLNEVKLGDIIVVQQDGQEWRYEVTEIGTTTPDDLTPVYPTQNDQLTLITCGSYDFFQDSYLERTVVVAQRVG